MQKSQYVFSRFYFLVNSPRIAVLNVTSNNISHSQMPLLVSLLSEVEISLQMVFTKNESTEAALRCLSFVNCICCLISECI